MLYFEVPIFGNMLCKYFFWQTQISNIAAALAWL